jgi:perosamine synthetase
MSDELAFFGGPPTLRPDSLGKWPDITVEDREAVMAVLDSGVLTAGEEASALARDYAAYHGIAHCLPFNAGTAALHACCVALGIGPGDEVIVPAFTYVASAIVVLQAGAKPVFCDVQPGTFTLDPRLLEERINERTKAIVAVHLHGMPCDLEEILAIADRHGLAVIEDSSQAHGARYRGRLVSTFGACAGASLNATKNLPGGEGGLFLSDDELLALTADRLRYMGEDLPSHDPQFGRRYWSHGIGFNYRAQEMPSAFARSQLKRLDAYNARAEENAKRLSASLAGTAGLRLPAVPEDRNSVWYLYRIGVEADAAGVSIAPPELRDRVVAALAAEGVPVMLWQHDPIPAFSAFRREPARPWHPSLSDDDLAPYDPDAYPVSREICDTTLTVGTGAAPLSVQSAEVVDGYATAITKVFGSLDRLVAAPFDVPETTMQAAEFARSRGRSGVPPVPGR